MLLTLGSGLCAVDKNYSTHAVKISNGQDEVKLFNGLDFTKENLFFLKANGLVFPRWRPESPTKIWPEASPAEKLSGEPLPNSAPFTKPKPMPELMENSHGLNTPSL
jgi:hypothetical protein